MNKIKSNILLIFIVLFGFFARTYGINWDQGHHMHPDERAIILFTTPLQLPRTIGEFFSPTSPLNTHFFAYGNFPIYLLKIVGNIAGIFDIRYTQYDQINLLGRIISALADTGTILVLFFLGKKLFNKHVGNLVSFFYAASVLAIQTSHFYAVDTLLTFFISLTLFSMVDFYTKPSKKTAVKVGVFFGFALATKNSALALLAPILLALSIDFLLIFFKTPHKMSHWLPHFPKFVKSLIVDGAIIASVAFAVFIFWNPYFLIDSQEFWSQTMQQYQMTHDAFTFPYTLQYVGKIPYIYELKNIFLWGQGPMIAVVSFIGIFYFTYIAVTKKKHTKWAQELILVVFFWSYFAVVGKFAIGFMRYMLPIYPLLSLFAAVVLWESIKTIGAIVTNNITTRIIYSILFVLFLLWPIAFLQIYNIPNTRVSATNWILSSIPTGSTVAVEHWDDSLPLSGQEKYTMLTLAMYDPDTPEKWATINEQLKQTDYIIIASNRLYVPLQKLSDCSHLPPFRCYSQSAQYYKKLFSGDLGFSKVAEFSNNPTIPFTNLSIDDQGADESFTVYDHPKILIFKKNAI